VSWRQSRLSCTSSWFAISWVPTVLRHSGGWSTLTVHPYARRVRWCIGLAQKVGSYGRGRDFVGSPYFCLSDSEFLLGRARLHSDFCGRGCQELRRFRLFLLVRALWWFKEGLSTWPANLYVAAVVLVEQAFQSGCLLYNMCSCRFGSLFSISRSKIFEFL